MQGRDVLLEQVLNGAGNLLVGDTYNNAIRSMSPERVVTVLVTTL
jgi:hypothetical protein